MEARAGLFSKGSKAPTGAQRLLSRLPRRSSQAERALTLAFAGALFVAIFALGIAVDDPAEAPSVLYVLPVALVAIRFGALGGIVAATFALALFGVVNAVNEEGAGVLGYLTRGTAFYVLGALLGNFSTRLRSTYEIVLRREQQLQAILDNSTAMIYLKDREGRYMLVNRSSRTLYVPARRALIGKPTATCSRRYQADAFRANDRRVLKEGKVARDRGDRARGRRRPHIHIREVPAARRDRQGVRRLRHLDGHHRAQGRRAGAQGEQGPGRPDHRRRPRGVRLDEPGRARSSPGTARPRRCSAGRRRRRWASGWPT